MGSNVYEVAIIIILFNATVNVKKFAEIKLPGFLIKYETLLSIQKRRIQTTQLLNYFKRFCRAMLS